MKNYRYLGQDAEVLGNRLDAAREARDRAKTTWARNYWNSAVERLLFQWHQLPILHDADACVSIIPRWTVDYNFYETGHVNEGFGITDRVFYKLVKENANLTDSWERNREKRLARAQ
jgi:hypothetical protein